MALRAAEVRPCAHVYNLVLHSETAQAFLPHLLGSPLFVQLVRWSRAPSALDPPRKLQSETYTGPITLSQYQRFKYVQEALAKDGFSIGLPTGN